MEVCDVAPHLTRYSTRSRGELCTRCKKNSTYITRELRQGLNLLGFCINHKP